MTATRQPLSESAQRLLTKLEGGSWWQSPGTYHRWVLWPERQVVSGESVRALIARDLIESTDGGATWKAR